MVSSEYQMELARREGTPELKRPLWIIGASDYNLGMAIRDVAEAERDYKEIHATDEQAADVTDRETLERYLKFIRKGSLDTGVDIVYAAGINMLDAIGDVDEVNLLGTFDVNVMGFIRLLRAVERVYFPGKELPEIKKQSRVNVVVIASDAARVPMRRSITYCASKAAVIQAMRVGARELAPFVRVNAVSPAIIDDTPMTTSIDAEVMLQRNWTRYQMDEYENSLIPMQRRASKWEVAEVVLSTLEGPEFLTGSNIEITGGK